MCLYEWIINVLVLARGDDPSNPQEGIDNFIEAAAEEFASHTEYKSPKMFEKRKEHFAQALLELLTIVPIVSSDLTLRLCYNGYIWGYMSVDATAWDFHGMCPEEEGKYSQVNWGIEYTDWAEWLGMNISEVFWQVASPLVLARVIWEMTWSGHTYKEAQKEAEKRLT